MILPLVSGTGQVAASLQSKPAKIHKIAKIRLYRKPALIGKTEIPFIGKDQVIQNLHIK